MEQIKVIMTHMGLTGNLRRRRRAKKKLGRKKRKWKENCIVSWSF
jgi:hypothetical protein